MFDDIFFVYCGLSIFMGLLDATAWLIKNIKSIKSGEPPNCWIMERQIKKGNIRREHLGNGKMTYVGLTDKGVQLIDFLKNNPWMMLTGLFLENFFRTYVEWPIYLFNMTAKCFKSQ